MTPLNQNGSKCFYREIQQISDCSRKFKAIAGLLMVLLVGQRTFKSYHKMQIDRESVLLTVFVQPTFNPKKAYGFQKMKLIIFTSTHTVVKMVNFGKSIFLSFSKTNNRKFMNFS